MAIAGQQAHTDALSALMLLSSALHDEGLWEQALRAEAAIDVVESIDLPD